MSPLLLGSSRFDRLCEFVPSNTPASVGFVGTAGEPYDDPWWVRQSRDRLVHLGFQAVDLALRPGSGDDLAAACDDLDVIFVAGGNTYHLLQAVRLSDFDEVLRQFLDRGGLYVGMSAGSIITGPDIDLTAEPDQRAATPHLETTRGLGWVPFAVLPHAGVRSERFLLHHSSIIERATAAHPIVRLTDDEAIVVDDEGVRFVWLANDDSPDED